jgi:hypothetical protein
MNIVSKYTVIIKLKLKMSQQNVLMKQYIHF